MIRVVQSRQLGSQVQNSVSATLIETMSQSNIDPNLCDKVDDDDLIHHAIMDTRGC